MSRHNLLGCASAENKNCKWEESWHPASGRHNDCFKLKTLKTSSEQLKWKFANFSSFFASAHVKLAIKLAAAAGVLCERSMKQTPIWLNENAFFIANQTGCDRIKASRKKMWKPIKVITIRSDGRKEPSKQASITELYTDGKVFNEI